MTNKKTSADLYKCATYGADLFKMIREGKKLDSWAKSKITEAVDRIASVYHYMEYESKLKEYRKELSSDMYSEDVKRHFMQKLTEARVKLEKIKTASINETVAEKEKSTGKFDKKEIAPGRVQYTRKSKTFTDGGEDKDVKAAKKKPKGVKEGAKPDFLDVDKDGNRKEPMKKAIADKDDTPIKERSTGNYSAKSARAGKDIGKPGKNFAKIADKAGKSYGSKERGEKVAGAVLAKLRKK